MINEFDSAVVKSNDRLVVRETKFCTLVAELLDVCLTVCENAVGPRR
jgi:hypothetical protein